MASAMIKSCNYWSQVVLFVAGFGFLSETTSSAAENGWRTSPDNLRAVLRCAGPAFIAAGGAVRIYYSADSCAAKDGSPLPFPRVKVQPPSKGLIGLAAVRDVFRKDNRVAITQDRAGIVRITIGRPSTAIMRTFIRSLPLDSDGQYTPELVVAGVETSEEFGAAEQKLGFHAPLRVLDMNVTEPAAGLPHLPAMLRDMTVGQIFDRVVKTFGGIVLYGTCQGPRSVRQVRCYYARNITH